MQRVNLVTETSWILGRCARELSSGFSYCYINVDSSKCDVSYHIPYWRGLDNKAKVTIGFFTHDLKRIRSLADKFDYHVCMNEEVKSYLEVAGFKPTIIRPGVDNQTRKPKFGVIGRIYSGTGRKGEKVVEQLQSKGFDIISCGPGWNTKVNYSINDRSKFYSDIDYLLITSTDEGGPIPVIEAISYNTPVIAPNVGWCWEFPVVRYDSVEGLVDTLHSLSNPPTWKQWVEDHGKLFENVNNSLAHR